VINFHYLKEQAIRMQMLSYTTERRLLREEVRSLSRGTWVYFSKMRSTLALWIRSMPSLCRLEGAEQADREAHRMSTVRAEEHSSLSGWFTI